MHELVVVPTLDGSSPLVVGCVALLVGPPPHRLARKHNALWTGQNAPLSSLWTLACSASGSDPWCGDRIQGGAIPCVTQVCPSLPLGVMACKSRTVGPNSDFVEQGTSLSAIVGLFWLAWLPSAPNRANRSPCHPHPAPLRGSSGRGHVRESSDARKG